MQILLTGAFGNVGMSVLTELLNRGYFVRIFELPTKRNKKIASQFIQTHNVEIIWGDLRNYLDILKAMENIDYVFHIGAIIPPMADKLPKLAEAVNVGGTHNVLKAIKAQKILQKYCIRLVLVFMGIDVIILGFGQLIRLIQAQMINMVIKKCALN